MEQREANDVLIVGAGPVGLTLANDLVRREVRCCIIDSAPQAMQQTKALGIQARTMELLAKMGVAQTAIERGLKSPAFSPYSDGKRLARVAFQQYLRDTPYPFVLMLPQHETEQVLTDQLQRQGCTISRQTELVNLAQDEQGVEVQLRHPDGEEERVRTSYLVGCDGSHSTVRHLLGLNFTGSAFEQSFAVGNVHITWDLPYDEVLAFVHRGSFIAYFPMADGRHRVMIAYELDQVPPGDVTLEEIQQMMEICGPAGARASDPQGLTRFHVNQRRAEHYARGRIFLAGDAAHIHSPVGAQGMNTGMQDAFNLAWKLALAVKGRASLSLLESYEAEREQVGEVLLRGTGRATRMVLTHNPLLMELRNLLAPLYFSSFPGALPRLAEALSELAIAYPPSPIVRDVRDKKGALQAGDRAPDGPLQTSKDAGPHSLFEILNSSRSVLLVFTGQQDAAAVERHWREITTLLGEGYGEMIEAYLLTQQSMPGTPPDPTTILHDVTGELHHRYGASQGGLLLIRPDGYIGFWGPFGATQTLRAYLQELFVSDGII